MGTLSHYMKLLEYLEMLKKFGIIDEAEYNEMRNLLTDSLLSQVNDGP